VYQQSLDYIKKNYSHTIGKKIGLFFSGGLDSYFLLHILGQAFPDLTIELFTFYHPAEYQNIEKLKQHLSTIQNIVFTPLECSYSYKHFCALFSTVYKNQNEIIGDEGYYSYLTFFELLKERNDIDTFFSADGIDVLFG
jgi:asparagine synthetase B (glutamine-hydrolysing)